MKKKILPYILLTILGMVLLIAPLIYRTVFAFKAEAVVKAVGSVSSRITLDMVIDYAQKILGVVVTIVGLIQTIKTLRPAKAKKIK